MNMVDLAHNIVGIERTPEPLSVRMDAAHKEALSVQRGFRKMTDQIRNAPDLDTALTFCEDADEQLKAIETADVEWQKLLAELKQLEG